MKSVRNILAGLMMAAAGVSALAQGSNGGILYASDFAKWTLPTANTPAKGAINWPNPEICKVSSSGYNFVALKIGRPVTIVDANPALTETVTPTQVLIGNSGCMMAATMQYSHNTYSVQSATAGLQEAIDYQSRWSRGAIIILTPEWTGLGGTTGMITSASGSTSASVLDERTSTVTPYAWNGSQYVAQPFGSGSVGPGSSFRLPSYPSGSASAVGPSNITTDVTGNNLTVPGSVAASALNMQAGPLSQELPNNTASGATLNKLVCAASIGGVANAQTCTTASTNWSGIATGGATGSTAGNTQFARGGNASCVFDGTTVFGDYVQISSTVAGDCHDSGSTVYPTSGAVVGRVRSVNGGAGTTAVVDVYSPGIIASTGTAPGTAQQVQTTDGSGHFAATAATITPAGDIATPTKLSVGTTVLHKDGVSPANLIAMGADPTGVADSTTAINSWLSYAASHGVEAYCPPGVYLTSGSTLTASHNNLHIKGPHWAYPNAQPGCHFKLTAASGSIFTSTVTTSSVEIENVWLDLNNVSGTDHALNTVLNRYWKFHDNLVNGAVAGAGTTYWQSGGDLYTWAYNNIFLGAAMYSLDWQGIYASVGNRGCNECWVWNNIDQVAGGVRFGGDVHYHHNDKEAGLTQLNPALSYAALVDCSDGTFPLACDVTSNYIEMAPNGGYPISSLSNDGTTTTIVSSTPPTGLSVGSLVSIENTHTSADGLNLRVATKSGSTITVAQTIGGGIVSIPSYTVSALSCVTGTCTVTTSATNPAVAGDAFYLSGTGTCADSTFDRWAITILSSTQFTFQVSSCTATASAGTIILGQIVGPYAGGLIGINVDSNNYSANIVGNRLWGGGLNKGDPNVAIKLNNLMGWAASGNLFEFWTTDKQVSFSALGAGSFFNCGESRGPGGVAGDGGTNFWEPGSTNSGTNVSTFGGIGGISCGPLGVQVYNHRLTFTASTYTGSTLDLSTGNVFRWTAAATISTVLNAKPGQIFSIEATATPVVLPTATFNNASGADATLVVNRPVWYQVGYAGNIREIGIGSTLANQSAGALWYSDASKPVAIQGTGFAKFNTSGAPTFFLPSGTGAKLASTTGTLTNTHCVSINGVGDFVDAGAACAGGTSYTVHLTGQTAAISNTTITTVGGARQCFVATSMLHTTAVGTAGTINSAIQATLDGSAVVLGTSNTINATTVPANGASLSSNLRYFCADAASNVIYNVGFTGVTGSYTYNLDITLQAVN